MGNNRFRGLLKSKNKSSFKGNTPSKVDSGKIIGPKTINLSVRNSKGVKTSDNFSEAQLGDMMIRQLLYIGQKRKMDYKPDYARYATKSLPADADKFKQKLIKYILKHPIKANPADVSSAEGKRKREDSDDDDDSLKSKGPEVFKTDVTNKRSRNDDDDNVGGGTGGT